MGTTDRGDAYVPRRAAARRTHSREEGSVEIEAILVALDVADSASPDDAPNDAPKDPSS